MPKAITETAKDLVIARLGHPIIGYIASVYLIGQWDEIYSFLRQPSSGYDPSYAWGLFSVIIGLTLAFLMPLLDLFARDLLEDTHKRIDEHKANSIKVSQSVEFTTLEKKNEELTEKLHEIEKKLEFWKRVYSKISSYVNSGMNTDSVEESWILRNGAEQIISSVEQDRKEKLRFKELHEEEKEERESLEKKLKDLQAEFKEWQNDVGWDQYTFDSLKEFNQELSGFVLYKIDIYNITEEDFQTVKHVTLAYNVALDSNSERRAKAFSNQQVFIQEYYEQLNNDERLQAKIISRENEEFLRP